MWGYTGSASGTSHPPALAFALVQHLLCRLDAPWGAHQHLLPQLQHWTCLAPCKWMGKGPASPSGASSVVTTMVLALDPTPIRGIQEQTGFHFVVFLVWFMLTGICLPPSHLARLTAGKELHKSTTFLVLFCISPWPFITEGWARRND